MMIKEINDALLVTQSFQDYPHRSASTPSAEETSNSSQISIPKKEKKKQWQASIN